MSVIESLLRQAKEAEENAVSEEEMLNTDAVESEDKEEVKDVNYEADEDIKGNDESDAIAEPQPKANNKRKAEDDKDENLEAEVNNMNVEVDESGIKDTQVSKREKIDDGKCLCPA